MGKPNPRQSNGNRRRKLKARLKAQGRPCAICGREIDYTLPAGHDWAFEVDEIVSVWRGGDPLDADNLQPVHRVCNRLKYQRERAALDAKRKEPPSAAKASRDW